MKLNSVFTKLTTTVRRHALALGATAAVAGAMAIAAPAASAQVSFGVQFGGYPHVYRGYYAPAPYYGYGYRPYYGYYGPRPYVRPYGYWHHGYWR